MFFCYTIGGEKMELIIGSHVSFNKNTQLIGSTLEAISYGATTFMFYTGAPQNTVRVLINDDLTKEAIDLMKSNNINLKDVIVHAPYIINLANKNNFDFNVRFLTEELKRVQELKIDKLVLHPGSHVGVGIEEGIKNIIDTLNQAMNFENSVTICLETMAGKGTELGRTFEEIKQIIDGVKHKDKIGVCLDTCHINDAGYDLSNFDDVLNEFDNVIGLNYLKVVHVNDSKNIRGSHKDRHENIGFGHIGFDNLLNVIYNKKLEKIPKILETPYIEKNAPYKEEIEMIRNKKFNENLINDVLN